MSKGVVDFFHPDYIDRDIDDLYAIEPKQRGALRVVLAAGYKVTGRVVDDAGKPVANAMIRAIRKDKTHRKGTTTDASGSFALRGVSGGLIMLTARALEIRQQTYLPIALKSDKLDLEVRLKPIELPANLKTYPVLGMQLADVTPELRSTYDLFGERGALIVDPGKDSDRLNIGRLAEGYAFYHGRPHADRQRERVRQPDRRRNGRSKRRRILCPRRVQLQHGRIRRDQNGQSEIHEGRPQAIANLVGAAAPEEP